MISERKLVSRIRRMAGTSPFTSRLVQGIGDDCAILRPKAGHDLVFTTDFVLEGRHFTLDTHKAADIGHKALARSLSDLAAMGSKPNFCLVSLAIPSKLGTRFVDGFYRGLLKLANQFEVALAGGDLARFEFVIADVTCCGEVPKEKAMLRRSARPGDRIYVTGEIGASAAGFETGKGKNFRRHLRPEPRVAVGMVLLGLGVRCCMDLSDGLALDLTRLCEESGVGAELSGSLPIARGAGLRHATSGGEDYELLFTAAEKLEVPSVLLGVPITRIGVITERRVGSVRFAGKSLRPNGFDHFG